MTPVIGLTTVYIAYQQYRLAKEKQRHELYDRRVKIFKEIMLFISLTKRQGDVTDEQLNSLLRETSEAKFLIKKADEFVATLYKNGIELQAINKQLNSSCGPQSADVRSHLAGERKRLQGWFGDQFEEGRKIFEPYLSLAAI